MIDTFKWCTHLQSSGGGMVTENDIRTVSFGSGYEQVAISGFNTTRREFAIVYAGNDYRDVYSFLIEHVANPFIWRAPSGDLGLFIVKQNSITMTPVSATAQEIKATFREQFTSAGVPPISR
ncbi:minor tail protein [Citrobacter phage HCF1]|uniref:Tail fiber protein n=1 Tax=Citrobacter phage HCF1 TaxID=2849700 RepID=A0ABX6D4B0_9CAUD|nr:minor tail protein [Citrobacter phage HCF1]